jgi:hypothetical protein
VLHRHRPEFGEHRRNAAPSRIFIGMIAGFRKKPLGKRGEIIKGMETESAGGPPGRAEDVRHDWETASRDLLEEKRRGVRKSGGPIGYLRDFSGRIDLRRYPQEFSLSFEISKKCLEIAVSHRTSAGSGRPL